MTSRILTAAALSLFAVSAVHAQASDDQIVTFTVEAINELVVSGAPSMTISTATAGNQPDADNSTGVATYAITTNETGQRIRASINSAMPTGLTLKITLAAPAASGSSAGAVTLSTSPADVVTAISNVAESGLAITYSLEATVFAAVPETPHERTVTLTITAGA